MNRNILIACVLGFSAQWAMAQDKALITKTNTTGFTAPEYARFETCEVFQNKVVITQKYGAFGEESFTNQEVRRIKLSPSISKVLQAAGTEELVKSDNFLCDGPSTNVTSSVGGEAIVLFSTGGCGSPRLERQGAKARMLLDLVTSYCPVTHDFGVQNTNLN